jgi:hypothetical protein
MSCYQYLLSSTYSYVITLRINGKFIAHLLGTERALLPTYLGDKVLTLGGLHIFSPILLSVLRLQRVRSVALALGS